MELLTVEDVAKMLQCSARTVRRYTKQGLACYRIGGKLLFKEADVLKFMEERREG